MSKEIHLPTTIRDLAVYNAQALLGLSLPIATRDYPESILAGLRYITSIYPNYHRPEERYKEYIFPKTEEEKIRFNLSNKIVQEFNPALLLVRPEMYHIRSKVEDFLRRNGFQIVYADERKVNKREYASLYNETFNVPEAKPSWPTRTIVYLDSPSYIIVFKDPLKRFGQASLADGFVQKYKGKEGIKDDKTLRGFVVLEEAIKLGFHKLEDYELALALDPFTALRNIIQLPGSQPHSHLPRELALLKYNAVSIHVPNSHELPRDLSILNNTYQLCIIYELLGKT